MYISIVSKYYVYVNTPIYVYPYQIAPPLARRLRLLIDHDYGIKRRSTICTYSHPTSLCWRGSQGQPSG